MLRADRIHLPLKIRSDDGALTVQSLFDVDLRVDDLQEGLLDVDYRWSRDDGVFIVGGEGRQLSRELCHEEQFVLLGATLFLD